MSITANFPTIRPTLNLDFVNSRTVDPRITFTRASTATYFDRLGVMRTAAVNEPRIDFDPVTLECKGLLIEEQRTNLLLRSADFNNSSWGKSEVTLTANAVVAPDGTLTGTKITESSTADATRLVAQFPAGLWNDNSKYTASVFAKAGERTILWMESRTKQPTFPAAFFDLANGIVRSTTGGATAKIEPVGNGWYRCSLTADALTGSYSPGIVLGPAVTSGVRHYTGDGTSGIYVWGAQLEAGAFPTSYIPTEASQVTRSVDSAVMTGTNFSSWYRQDEGSFLVDGSFNQPSTTCRLIDAHRNGSYNDQIYLQRNALNAYIIQSGAGGNQNGSAFAGTSTASSFKLAGAYRTNDYAVSLNGGVAGVDTSATVPNGINGMSIGSARSNVEVLNGHLRRVAYYPARLPNAQLQALTA